MPTDTERREVARRLRNCRSGWTSGTCYYTIIQALGVPDTSREDGGNALYSVIADLIEPSCDRDALLALADEMETADPEDLDVAIDCLTDCAARICEALGVSDD